MLYYHYMLLHLTHFSMFLVVLTLSFLCRSCLQTAVRMTEANWRTRRRRITHTSCCWPHRPKSHRPIRNPVKVSVCLNIIQGQVFSFFPHKTTNHFSFFIPAQISTEWLKRWPHFPEYLLNLCWCCLTCQNTSHADQRVHAHESTVAVSMFAGPP